MSNEAAGTGFVPGGVTPEEASLARYTFGQKALKGAGAFGSSGLGMSTNETMAGTVGPTVGQAVNLGQMSDQLSAALAEFANSQQAQAKGINQQAIGNLGTFLGKTGGTS